MSFVDMAKPEFCPFCGSDSAIAVKGTAYLYKDPAWWVFCGDCNANGPITGKEEEAIIAWNRRIKG